VSLFPAQQPLCENRNVIVLEAVFVALGALVVAMNVVVLRRLWASAMFDRGQKIAQTVLLWLLPGSVFLVWAVVREPAAGGRRDRIDEVIDVLAGADDVGAPGGHHVDHDGHFSDHAGIDGGGHG
jgi:hypothetical protein